jgi:phosphoribosylglycinamide formyltransferase-1
MHRIAVFASGKGTNFEAIVTACNNAELDAKVVLLVCDKPQAEVVAKAERFGIECFAFNPKEYSSKEQYEAQIVELLDRAEVELVCLAGYMRIVGETLYNAYQGRILNIHPALLPSFKGAHGIDDAFNFGVKVFGVTVHFIDLTIDGGIIVMQRAFEYYGNDRDEVETRIHAIEHELYPEAICKVLEK